MTILDETVDMFNQLVQTIEERMPNPSVKTEKEAIVGLVDEGILKSMHLAPDFLYSFLLRAHRPHFELIVPGLSTPNSSSFANQPFWSHLNTLAPHDHKFPPTLLFASSRPYTSPNLHARPETASFASLLKASYHIYSHAFSLSDAICQIYRHYIREVEKAKIDPDHPFYYPFSKMRDYSAGLYSSSYGDTEDEVKLLLPAHVEGNGLARRSDGAEARLREDVYGVGFTPFAGWRSASLLDVLTHWLGMVESGARSIDEHGVVDSIEKWVDADVDDTAGEYVIPMPLY